MNVTNSLDGTHKIAPFGQLEPTVIDAYRQLQDEYGADRVLVLTGAPTSMETFEELLSDSIEGVSVPRVASMVVHATEVVNAVSDIAILSDSLRRELVHRFLASFDWESDYFQQAATLDSFEGDIAQLMETAAWQNTTFDETPELSEIESVLDEFQTWLTENGHIERGQLLPTALEFLTEDSLREDVIDFDAVLAVEFEEFFPLDRDYLNAVTENAELVCVSERDSSIRRTGVETGSITGQVSMPETTVEPTASTESRPAATAKYLATGEVPEDPETGTVSVLHGKSADSQIDRVADEIERLRSNEDWEYNAFAVALKQGGSAVSETIQALTQAGIPTESTTVTGFGDDPAIRELLQVTRHFTPADTGEELTIASERSVDTDLLSTIEAEEDSIRDVIRRWATESGLKERIASRESPLDARSQFGNVKRAFAMAEFIEETPFIDATWEHYGEMLERAHEHAETTTRTSATGLSGGVRVDHLQALKNGSWRAVFILDVIDSEYPGKQFFSRLFPQERVLDMPDFPGVTTVSPEEVETTFQTSSTMSSRPIRQYHIEQVRRQLAVGAKAATDRLYFSLYDYADTGLDEQVQASRFLTEAYRQLPWIRAEAETEIWSEREAELFALSRIDRALRDVRRAKSQDISLSLDAVAADLNEIQALLDNSGEHGDELRAALRARLDFAQGRVRRD